MKSQVKSKQRVTEHGEVFTAEREVKVMCDLVKEETERIDYEKNTLLAVSSVYGVDILIDNVVACRERLYQIWAKEYQEICKKQCCEDMHRSIRFILSRNIVCENALSLRCVDENGTDTSEPIVFSEWAFITGMQLQRSDYRFDALLHEPQEEKQLAFDSENSEGIFLQKYIANYRRIWENG